MGMPSDPGDFSGVRAGGDSRAGSFDRLSDGGGECGPRPRECQSRRHVLFIRSRGGHKDRASRSSVAQPTRSTDLTSARLVLVRDPQEPALFLTRYDTRLRVKAIQRLARWHARRADIPQPLTPHHLRHACATHLLKSSQGRRRHPPHPAAARSTPASTPPPSTPASCPSTSRSPSRRPIRARTPGAKDEASAVESAVMSASPDDLAVVDETAFDACDAPAPDQALVAAVWAGLFGAPAEYASFYFGARYLASELGRFTTVDPVYTWQETLVDPQRWNRYTYVRNNPLKYTDPDGKNPLAIAGGIGAVVYGGWATYQNVSHGRPWYNNVGMEASKGLLVGVTLGLAAPALATADVGIGTGTVMLDAAAVGKAREVLVAELVGGRVAGDAKVTPQGVGTTAVDVYGRAGEFIGVGGPAKAGDLAAFGKKLQILAGAAEQAGVKAQYYLAKGTPDAAIKVAQKWLGKEIVFLFEMKQ
jgi:RHS repeat-associated protein